MSHYRFALHTVYFQACFPDLGPLWGKEPCAREFVLADAGLEAFFDRMLRNPLEVRRAFEQRGTSGTLPEDPCEVFRRHQRNVGHLAPLARRLASCHLLNRPVADALEEFLSMEGALVCVNAAAPKFPRNLLLRPAVARRMVVDLKSRVAEYGGNRWYATPHAGKETVLLTDYYAGGKLVP